MGYLESDIGGESASNSVTEKHHFSTASKNVDHIIDLHSGSEVILNGLNWIFYQREEIQGITWTSNSLVSSFTLPVDPEFFNEVRTLGPSQLGKTVATRLSLEIDW